MYPFSGNFIHAMLPVSTNLLLSVKLNGKSLKLIGIMVLSYYNSMYTHYCNIYISLIYYGNHKPLHLTVQCIYRVLCLFVHPEALSPSKIIAIYHHQRSSSKIFISFQIRQLQVQKYYSCPTQAGGCDCGIVPESHRPKAHTGCDHIRLGACRTGVTVI